MVCKLVSLLTCAIKHTGGKNMSANIDMTNNRANIAFIGSRNDIWHRMGVAIAA